jgi:hypothetical protein
MDKTYPARLSVDELRAELDAYIAERKRTGKKDPTLDLDRRKVDYFLDWLDDGRLPG